MSWKCSHAICALLCRLPLNPPPEACCRLPPLVSSWRWPHRTCSCHSRPARLAVSRTPALAAPLPAPYLLYHLPLPGPGSLLDPPALSGTVTPTSHRCCLILKMPFLSFTVRPQVTSGHRIGRRAFHRCGRSRWSGLFQQLTWLLTKQSNYHLGIVASVVAHQPLAA